MRNKIRLDTLHDAYAFVAAVTPLEGKITLTDGEGLRANARSTLGVLYSLEFANLWVESENDIYDHIRRFVVEE